MCSAYSFTLLTLPLYFSFVNKYKYIALNNYNNVSLNLCRAEDFKMYLKTSVCILIMMIVTMALASNRKDQINGIIPQVMAIHFNSHSPLNVNAMGSNRVRDI